MTLTAATVNAPASRSACIVPTRSGLLPDCENATASCPETRNGACWSVATDIGSDATGTPMRLIVRLAK